MGGKGGGGGGVVGVFFFNDTATTEIYTLSLHDALPICKCEQVYLQAISSVFESVNHCSSIQVQVQESARLQLSTSQSLELIWP